NDVRAAGLASLEDFLMQVEEQTSITWMQPKGPAVKTPSAGLTAAALAPLAPHASPPPAPPPPPSPSSDLASSPTVMATPHPPGPQPPPSSLAATGKARVLDPPSNGFDAPATVLNSDRSTAKRP